MSHGVRAVEDPALVSELAERGIVLEVCPTSNVATGVYRSYADHPLGALRDAGVRVTLASDDPPYFGATIGGEYALAAERFGMEEAALREVTRTAIAAGFAEDAVKQRLFERVDGPADRSST
jgi:adenosine deaminase